MRISNILSQAGAEAVKGLKADKKIDAPMERKKIKDSSSISNDGKRLSETASEVSAVQSHIEVQPDVRVEKVQEVRGKIKNGFYNSEEFIDQLAEKIMKDFGI